MVYVKDGLKELYFGWELEMVQDFVDHLYSNIPIRGEDRMVWSQRSNGFFDVHSYDDALRGHNEEYFPWNVIFFSWTTTLGRILTVDNLIKRKVIIVDWCCMCKRTGETVDHILLHCDVARELWLFVFSLFGVQ